MSENEIVNELTQVIEETKKQILDKEKELDSLVEQLNVLEGTNDVEEENQV